MRKTNCAYKIARSLEQIGQHHDHIPDSNQKSKHSPISSLHNFSPFHVQSAPRMSFHETLILHLKEGVSLDDVASDSPPMQTFIQLTEIVKSQQGFLRQFWVDQYLLGVLKKYLTIAIGPSGRRSTRFCLGHRYGYRCLF